MLPKISVFIATTLDGFIAREDGSIDWLNQFNTTVPQGEDCGYKSFISTVDAIIMGRNSYETVLDFEPWPYDLPVIVLSSSRLDIPQHLASRVTHSLEKPKELIARLNQEGKRHVYLDGGKTIQSFLQANLVDEITITLIPVLLGSGRSLFGRLGNDIQLKLIHSIPYDFGGVQLKYQVIKST